MTLTTTAASRVTTLASHAALTSTIPLFHAAWLFALGIALAGSIYLRASFVLVGLLIAGIVSLVAIVRSLKLAWLPLMLVWLLLGAWCALMEPRPRADPLLLQMADGLARTVEGTIIATSAIRPESDEESVDAVQDERTAQRIDLRIATIESVTDDSDVQMRAAGMVRLFMRAPFYGLNAVPAAQAADSTLRCGDRARMTVRLSEPEVYRDPGVWNREEYQVAQGISASGNIDFASIEKLGSDHSLRALISCIFKRGQNTFTEHLLALPQAMSAFPSVLRISEQDAAMLAAMVAGDRTYLTRTLRVGFERTGSFHMLVVSGFHLAIVAAAVFWIARRVRMPRTVATLCTLIFATVYAMLTGFGLPVQRSLWMVALYMTGRLLYRERSRLNSIGFAALCMLAASPRSLFDAGLQMTLLAVVSIAGVAEPLLARSIHPYLEAMRDLSRIAVDAKLAPAQAQLRVTLRLFISAFDHSRLARPAWAVLPRLARWTLIAGEWLVVSFIVELAMTLPMALYFHRITVYALPANLLVLPLLMGLVPAALLMTVVSLVSVHAAAVPGMLVAALLHFGSWVVHLPGTGAWADMRIPPPTHLCCIAFCALLAVALALARAKKIPPQFVWLALALAAIASFIPRAVDHPRDALFVEAIDVGQGDSLLLIMPDGRTLLVDGGGPVGGPRAASDNFDFGEEVVSPALWSRGIRRLDAVALSHAHSDHMGGLPAVLRNFRPRELWVGNNPSSPAYDALLREAAELGVQTKSFRAGDGFAFGSASVGVLAPMRDYQPGYEATNNDSLVLRVAYGNSSVLLEGDAEAPIENAMLAEQNLQSSLLKVGHHGSLTSTRPEFLARVAPQCAVISCGLRNHFGHPRREILSELESAEVRTYVTDISGTICFSLNGRTVIPDPACGWENSR